MAVPNFKFTATSCLSLNLWSLMAAILPSGSRRTLKKGFFCLNGMPKAFFICTKEIWSLR